MSVIKATKKPFPKSPFYDILWWYSQKRKSFLVQRNDYIISLCRSFPGRKSCLFPAGGPWWSRRNHVPMCYKWVVYGIVFTHVNDIAASYMIDWLGGLNDNTLALIGLKERNIYILAWNVITPHSLCKEPHTVPWFLCVQVPWRLFSLCWRTRWWGWNVSRAAAWLRVRHRWLVTTGNSLLEQFETFGDQFWTGTRG